MATTTSNTNNRTPLSPRTRSPSSPRSRSVSPSWRSGGISDFATSFGSRPQTASQISPARNSISCAPSFSIPRYHFPPHLVRVPRQVSSLSSPILYPEHYSYPTSLHSSRPITPASSPASPLQAPNNNHNYHAIPLLNSSHHVPETHHVTKDYDERTGNKTVNRYEFLKSIGQGMHGKVKLARDLETDQLVAIKIVDTKPRKRLGTHHKDEQTHKIRKEIAIMKKCLHPNVVSLLEVMDDEKSKKVYLVLEYMEGGQLSWRDEHNIPILAIDQVRSYFRDAVLGLEYLHFQGIIHRDIKPANLLLDANSRLKISDFGVSHLAEIDEETGELMTENDLELCKTVGSPAFFAPELCQTEVENRPSITKAIDVWALGITLYCFLFGTTPFPEEGNEFMLFNQICHDPIVIPESGRQIDDEVRDLLKRLLMKNPEERITLEEVKLHPFVVKGIDDLKSWIEETDPRRAGLKLEVTAEEVDSAVSLIERVKRKLVQLQTKMFGGLRRRATTGRLVSSRSSSTSKIRSPSQSNTEPNSPSASYFESRRASAHSIGAISIESNASSLGAETLSLAPVPETEKAMDLTQQSPTGTTTSTQSLHNRRPSTPTAVTSYRASIRDLGSSDSSPRLRTSSPLKSNTNIAGVSSHPSGSIRIKNARAMLDGSGTRSRAISDLSGAGGGGSGLDSEKPSRAKTVANHIRDDNHKGNYLDDEDDDDSDDGVGGLRLDFKNKGSRHENHLSQRQRQRDQESGQDEM